MVVGVTQYTFSAEQIEGVDEQCCQKLDKNWSHHVVPKLLQKNKFVHTMLLICLMTKL